LEHDNVTQYKQYFIIELNDTSDAISFVTIAMPLQELSIRNNVVQKRKYKF
jgi:hypothetical protein